MSVGSPPLGTLLVQRLDAVLGTTLSQQANVVTGARPDAVSQPENPNRPNASQNDTIRHPRESIDRTTAHAEQQGRRKVDRAVLDTRRGDSESESTRNAPNTRITPSAPTTLGFAAKTILALLANYPDKASAIAGKSPLSKPAPSSSGQSTNVSNTTGVSATAQPLATTAPAFAQALMRAVQASGLFYESHLNDLAFGKQTLSNLQQEPQGQIARPTQIADIKAPDPGAQAPTTTGPESLPPATTLPAKADPALANGPLSPTSTTTLQTAAAPDGSALSGLHPETHLLVRQQLEVLANQNFVWQGEAWPDAPMHWEVARRDNAEPDSDLATQTHWATRIAITAPNLGEVQANIHLTGQQLVIHLLAPESSQRLNEHSEILRSRYTAAGLHLSHLSIDADEIDGAA